MNEGDKVAPLDDYGLDDFAATHLFISGFLKEPWESVRTEVGVLNTHLQSLATLTHRLKRGMFNEAGYRSQGHSGDDDESE